MERAAALFLFESALFVVAQSTVISCSDIRAENVASYCIVSESKCFRFGANSGDYMVNVIQVDSKMTLGKYVESNCSMINSVPLTGNKQLATAAQRLSKDWTIFATYKFGMFSLNTATGEWKKCETVLTHLLTDRDNNRLFGTRYKCIYTMDLDTQTTRKNYRHRANVHSLARDSAMGLLFLSDSLHRLYRKKDVRGSRPVLLPSQRVTEICLNEKIKNLFTKHTSKSNDVITVLSYEGKFLKKLNPRARIDIVAVDIYRAEILYKESGWLYVFNTETERGRKVKISRVASRVRMVYISDYILGSIGFRFVVFDRQWNLLKKIEPPCQCGTATSLTFV